jgi:hypothetical protein
MDQEKIMLVTKNDIVLINDLKKILIEFNESINSIEHLDIISTLTLEIKNQILNEVGRCLNISGSPIESLIDTRNVNEALEIEEDEINFLIVKLSDMYKKVIDNTSGILKNIVEPFREIKLSDSDEEHIYNLEELLKYFSENESYIKKQIIERRVRVNEYNDSVSGREDKERKNKLIGALKELSESEVDVISGIIASKHMDKIVRRINKVHGQSLRDEIKKDIIEESLLGKIKTNASEAAESINNKLVDISNELQSKKEEYARQSEHINDLLSSISEKGITGNYGKFANKESRIAEILRVLSVVFMSMSIGVIIYTLFQMSDSESAGLVNDMSLAIRVMLALSISVPAAYLAKESSRHRVQEHHYRKIQLDINTLEPFTASFDIEDRNELKREMASKIFSKDSVLNNKNSYPIDVQELVLELLRNAKNSAKENSK